VILNLVKNAADAMKGAPRGERRLRPVTGFDRKWVVSLYIQDSGPGITAENKNHIFDPFFTTNLTGMGMGCLFVELSSKTRVATCGLLERVTVGLKF
jgi:C4-dicarboxylate-specific signal transduction histidine kinase